MPAKMQQEAARPDTRQRATSTPNVMANVHDNVARTAAEFMKNQQFSPGDIEEIMHGGHHVHDKGHKDQGPLQGSIVDMLSQGQRHRFSLGVGHPQTTDQASGTPRIKDQVVQREHIDSMNIEHIFHGEHNVHQHVDEANYCPKNKVFYQDIVDLELRYRPEQALGQEKREFENRQKDEMGNDTNDASNWQEVRDLHKEYLQKIYSKIRELSQPDLDTAEWEQGDDDIWGMKDPQQLNAGESELEHEIKMWGRTEPKENRKAYNVLHGRRGMNEEEGGQNEKKSDEGAPEERNLNM